MLKFDHFIETSTTTGDGESIYFPYWIFGKGYVIPTMEKRRSIEDKLDRFRIYALISMGVFALCTFAVFWHYTVLDGLLRMDIALGGIMFYGLLSLVSSIFMNKQLLAGLEKSNERYPFLEAARSRSQSLNLAKFIFIEILLLFFIFAFVVEGYFRPALSPPNPQPSLLLIICICISFIICVLLFAWFIFLFSINPNYWGMDSFHKNSVAYKTTEDGKILYFPKGLANKGYILPDQMVFEKITHVKKIEMVFLIFFGIITLIVQILSPITNIDSNTNVIAIASSIFLLTMLSTILFNNRKIQKKYLVGLEEVPAEMTRLELIKKNMISMSWFNVVFLFFSLSVFLYLGYIMAFEPSVNPEFSRLLGIIFLIILIPIFICFCYLVYLKFRAYFHL